MVNTVLGVVYFIAFSHALLLAASLYKRSVKKGAGHLLAMLMVIMGYKLFEGGVLYTGLYKALPHTMDLLPLAALFLGPVFYLYVRRVIGRIPKPWYFSFLHFVPGLILWLYNSPSVFRSAEDKVAMWQFVLTSGDSMSLPPFIVVLLLSVKVHLGTYLWLSWRSIQQFEVVAAQLRADDTQQVLKRLKLTVIGLIVLESIWVGLFALQQFLSVDTLGSVSTIWLLFVAFFVLAFGYFGLQKPNLVFDEEERKLTEHGIAHQPAVGTPKSSSANKVKYFHSALPESTLDVLAKSVESKLQNDQLYLDDKLSLTKLAKLTDIRSHTLSQVISQSMNTNFYKLINGYRVQHAVNLIENSSNCWSLERIALESGFSNRVTFVKAFKEVIGCTPSAHKKQYLAEQA